MVSGSTLSFAFVILSARFWREGSCVFLSRRLRKNVCSVRFAMRKPAAARKYYFSATYGTFSLRSPMAESHGLPSRALMRGFTQEDFFRNLLGHESRAQARA